MTQHSLAIGAFNEDLRSVHKESGISAAIFARFVRLLFVFCCVLVVLFVFARIENDDRNNENSQQCEADNTCCHN